MSMREYGIRGFGVCFDKVANYFDRKKAVEWLLLKEEECDGRSNAEIMEEILQLQDSVIEFAWTDETSYILIYEILPWQMSHKDWKGLETEQLAKEYMWDKLHEFFDDRLIQEDFYYMLDIVDDTYLG